MKKYIVPRNIKSDYGENFDTVDNFFILSAQEYQNLDEYMKKFSYSDFVASNETDKSCFLRTDIVCKQNDDVIIKFEENESVELHSVYSDESLSETLNPDAVSEKAEWIGVDGFSRANIRLSFNLDKNVDKNLYTLKAIKRLGKTQGYILSCGAYPQTRVSNVLMQELEEAFNQGKLQNGLVASKRNYVINNKEGLSDYSTKLCPEFIYNNQRYVRLQNYKDISWFKVEPIEFYVINWKDIKKSSETSFELISKNCFLGGVPYFDMSSVDQTWKHSPVRNYLQNQFVMSNVLDLQNSAMQEFVFPKDEVCVSDGAFIGCVGLEKLVLHKDVRLVFDNAFDCCEFNYVYELAGSDNLYLSKNEPNEAEKQNVYNLSAYKRVFLDLENSDIVKDKAFIYKFSKLVSKLDKMNLCMSYTFVKELYNLGKFDDFVQNANFAFLKNEIPNLKERFVGKNRNEVKGFFKFAYFMGCFSKQKYKPDSNVLFGQKASYLVGQFVKTNTVRIGRYAYLFDKLAYKENLNSELIEFLSVKNSNKEYVNVHMIESVSPLQNVWTIVVSDFDKIKKLRTQEVDNKTKNVHWEQAVLKHIENEEYFGVDETNQYIADELKIYGASQEAFMKTENEINQAKNKGMNHHILNKPLKEKSVLDQIEQVKKDTGNLIIGAKQIVQSKYDELFSYEMLDKLDPKNAIMGLMCSCCAIITNLEYGKDIAADPYKAEDIQNLVIKDSKGEIIAKTTMYVNKQLGFVVCNDIEINSKFKKDESAKEDEKGRYTSGVASKAEQTRQAIFNAIIRGINAFVCEYDAQNPNNPIKKVNMGMGFNRLKRQCDGFKKETNNLKVPIEYSFLDALDEQRVLYERQEPVKKSEEDMQLWN